MSTTFKSNDSLVSQVPQDSGVADNNALSAYERLMARGAMKDRTVRTARAKALARLKKNYPLSDLFSVFH